MTIATATISGQFVLPDLSGSKMTATIEAHADASLVTYLGMVIGGKIRIPIGSDGTASVTVPQIPQAGLLPATGVTWHVQVKVHGDIRDYYFPLTGNTTWDQVLIPSNAVAPPGLLGEVEDAVADALAAADAAASAARAWVPFPGIDILGDSITALNGGTVPTGTQPSGATYPTVSSPQARGYLFHAVTLLGHRARAGTNFGIGGQTSAQILSRVADVIASPNPIVVVYAGINDVAQGVSATTTKQNLLAIYKQLRAAGKTVVTATVGSSLTISGAAVTNAAGIASGVTSFTAAAGANTGDVLLLGVGTANVETVTVQSVTGTGPFTVNLTGATTKSHARGDLFRNTTKLAVLHDVNQWIIDYCRGRYTDPNTGLIVEGGTSGIYMVDWHSLVADPTTGQPVGALDATGAIIGVSTNPFVYTVDGTHPGQNVAHRMGHALAIVLDRLLPPLPIRNGDNTEAANLLANGRCVGNSSGLSTGYTLTAFSGTLTATPTKVTRTDGIPGEMQQVAVGPGNTCTVASLLVGDTTGLVFNGTDAYVLEVEFETDNNLVLQTTPPGGSVPLCARVDFRSAGGIVASGHSLFAASGSDGAGSIVDSSGVFRTERVVVPNTAIRVQALVLSGGVDTLTFRVKSARVRKVA